MNYNLECIIKTKDLPVDDQTVQHLLSDPSCDGGQWDMIANLVNKYGLVPKVFIKKVTIVVVQVN